MYQRYAILHRQSLNGDRCRFEDFGGQFPRQFDLACQFLRLLRKRIHLMLHCRHALVLVEVLPHTLRHIHLLL